MVALLATREDIEDTLNDQRLPFKPQDLPHCYARDVNVPRNHTEAMRSEHAYIFGRTLQVGNFTDYWRRGHLSPCSNESTITSTQCECSIGKQMSTDGQLKPRQEW